MMMTKKSTTKKSKSMTALAAFVAISFLTVTTTTVGIVAYSADPAISQPSSSPIQSLRQVWLALCR